MWKYLKVLWEDYIETRDTGVRPDDKTFDDTFWSNIEDVWTKFKAYMEQEDEHGLLGTLCSNRHEDHVDGEPFNQRDQALCELALRALCFKHRISLIGSTANTENLDQ
ncbi:hypothetical protein AK88_05405 [Plasmodium fragile]|uniref:Uncharacterized protein n=1 Tax=Plasmodium fragile TaxID=5857 RepID=A0A0D9QGW5_PLAFR|nr:uncharacterized protein AK88_05405 [Plasmodium fragile]KJP84966.1 hypothetical protein AK88_05405 [Plasmodium fragile]